MSYQVDFTRILASSSAIRSRFTPGHKRDTSSSSVESYASDTSISTVFSRSDKGEDDVVIVNPEDDHGRDAVVTDLRKQPRTRPFSQIFDSVVKSVLRFSPPSPRLVWSRLGPVNLKEVEELAKAREGGVVSFTMSNGSYVPHSQLVDTLEHLAVMMPMVQSLVLISQVYTLEELNVITSILPKFVNLTSLSIFDAMDDPPEDSVMTGKIITRWAAKCPTLRTVQLSRSTAWRGEVLFDEDGDETERWAEGDSSAY
ncbi:hypothetical protein FRB96_009225 [Tulasnella sp. 330]|nr:hypothetical protein FRB96_009225 [Tulasnella sp. 330]